jgi:uracil-DNA glycosylase
VPARDLRALTAEIVACRACPRLVAWREDVAREKRAAYRDEEYWGRPVPGFGDRHARLLLVGLAPAAHGGNRTGRVFTGDRSGDFLFASLHRTGYASRPESIRAGDGLELTDAYIAAAVRCAPPANKPTPRERDTCMPYLVRELQLLRQLRVIVVLGAFGYEATWATVRAAALPGVALPARRPRFAHGLEVPCGRVTVVGAFHPSQQNNFTGKLPPGMLDEVFVRTRQLIHANASPTP